MNAVFLTPQRLAIGGMVIVFAVLLRVPIAMVVVIAIAALVVGYRWLRGFNATEEALEEAARVRPARAQFPAQRREGDGRLVRRRQDARAGVVQQALEVGRFMAFPARRAKAGRG